MRKGGIEPRGVQSQRHRAACAPASQRAGGRYPGDGSEAGAGGRKSTDQRGDRAAGRAGSRAGVSIRQHGIGYARSGNAQAYRAGGSAARQPASRRYPGDGSRAGARKLLSRRKGDGRCEGVGRAQLRVDLVQRGFKRRRAQPHRDRAGGPAAGQGTGCRYAGDGARAGARGTSAPLQT